MNRPCLLLAALCLAGAAFAQTARPSADDPALDARMMLIAQELRCLVCQNQTIADSHAGLAVDLRQQIREQLQAGRSPDEIRRFMTERYGDFVLYRPPVDERTALLWFGPALLVAAGAAALLIALRRRSRLPDEAFDPDEEPPPHDRPDR